MSISRVIQTSISALLIILFTLFISQVVVAYEDNTNKYIIFVIDRQSLIDNEVEGSNLLQSLIGMISEIEENTSLYFIPADNPEKSTNSFLSKDKSKIEINYQYILEEIRQYNSSIEKITYYKKLEPDFESALIKSYNLLNINSAADSSKILLISGGEKSFPNIDNINPTLNLLSNNQWEINSFELPSNSSDISSSNENAISADKFLSDLSNRTSGEKLDLIDVYSLNTLFENTFDSNPNFSFSELLNEKLKSNQTFSKEFTIAPGTTKTNIWIFKEDIDGTIKINKSSDNLNGNNLDKINFYTIDTPHINIWEIENPEAGKWELEVNNYDGDLLIYYFSSNDLRPILSTKGPFPNNKPITLIAYVADKNTPITLEKIQIIAKITTESKTELIYELNDKAKTGDAVANDGYFSATIPSLNQTGTHFVDLDINWLESGHMITSKSEIITKPFPSINITSIESKNLSLNSRVKVAKLLINIEGTPYSIPSEELLFTINSNIKESGLIEIIPENISENTASEFYIYFTPYGEGTYTVNFSMNIKYAGEDYKYRSEYILISSIPPTLYSPIVPTPTILGLESNSVLPTTNPINNIEIKSSKNENILNTILFIAIILIVISLLFLIYFKTRNAPFGYIYDDKNKLLIDFSKLKRNKILSLVYKDIIQGKELNIHELENIKFKFNKSSISIKNINDIPRLRINNQPLIKKTEIIERSWIGSSGRLFSIFLNKPDLKSLTIIEPENLI